MNREQELALLIKEQAADLARGEYQPREPFVAFSLDEPLGQMFLEQGGKDRTLGDYQGCSLHGAKDYYWDASGVGRCRACNREHSRLYRIVHRERYNAANRANGRRYREQHREELRVKERERMRRSRAARKAAAE